VSWASSPGVTSCEQHAIVSYPSKRIDSGSGQGNGARYAARLSPSSSSWRNKIRRALRMVRRLIKLSVVLAPVALLYPLAMLANRIEGGSTGEDSQQQSKKDAHMIALESAPDSDAVAGFVGWYLRMCLRCVESSGAAVIKLMQWAGSRPDLFGHDFCSVFSALQDSTTPHAFRHTDAAMRQSYGLDWKDRIELHDILGSGCIGQVYRGKVRVGEGMRQEMREVAVKVLHPNVEDDIDADLDLLRFAVRVVENVPLLFKGLYWMNLQEIVEEFAGMLKLQLDLRNEAENLARFNSNFANDPSVVFPRLVPNYKPTKDVLIESFCDGVPVLQFAKDNAKNPELLHKLCLTAIHAVCKMIFLDNFMHGKEIVFMLRV
jgi:predicted unusual protein kinase regulating ubiquinone biosynthesis (AarF/ABC1/UbiB family)